jgi:hypothetical protein
MTNLGSHTAVGDAPAIARTSNHIARRALEVALAVAIVAALAGAWLTFFSFVPFDFTPQR